jgi:DNA-binding transcriptional regulator YhcF (GntR family)
MKYFIDPENNKAAYIQLYEQLRNDITGGLYSFGAKLPSKRLLAEESGVSVITAEHAYEILCDEGYTEAKKRSGYYVIYKHDDFWISDGRPVAENIFEENVAGTPLPDSCLYICRQHCRHKSSHPADSHTRRYCQTRPRQL